MSLTTYGFVHGLCNNFKQNIGTITTYYVCKYSLFSQRSYTYKVLLGE